ncbi:MAG TPA: glycosyltransferase family 1 protein, partial [Anaerolineae bacterium]
MIIGIDASRITTGTSTGTERYAREVISALVKLAPQHTYRLYTRAPLDSDFLQSLMAVRAAPILVVMMRQPHLWTHLRLARELNTRPPDALFIPAHVLPLPQAYHRTTRTVVTIHDVGYRHFPAAHPFKQRAYLDVSTSISARFASAIIADSAATKADVQRYYHTPETRIHVAYPGPVPLASVTEEEESAVGAKYNLTVEQPYVLSIGTLQPRKNLRRLLLAFAQLMSHHAQTPGDARRPHLLIAGKPGWGGEDLQGDVRRLDLTDYVRFLGYVDDKEKAVLLKRASVFAFPSLYEGFGFPVLEAQQAGVPVVCSNTSS